MQSRIFFIITKFVSVTCHFVTLSLLEIITIYLTQETFLIIINVKNNFATFLEFLINMKFNDLNLFAFIKYINQIC